MHLFFFFFFFLRGVGWGEGGGEDRQDLCALGQVRGNEIHRQVKVGLRKRPAFIVHSQKEMP